MIDFCEESVGHIDGSFGESGCQILHAALALSCILKRSVEITDIGKSEKGPASSRSTLPRSGPLPPSAVYRWRELNFCSRH